MAEYKGYSIEGDGTYGYSYIKPIGKGSVHLSLRGAYTTGQAAQRAIDNYLANKADKGGETEQCS
jgi:hypothetical protein